MGDEAGALPLRVAVASRGGVLVDECFGRAERFYVYEEAAGGFRLVEIRPGPAPCRGGRHEQGALAGLVALVADCPVVLAGRIGPEALRLLAANGTSGFAVHIGVEDALRRLARPAPAHEDKEKENHGRQSAIVRS